MDPDPEIFVYRPQPQVFETIFWVNDPTMAGSLVNLKLIPICPRTNRKFPYVVDSSRSTVDSYQSIAAWHKNTRRMPRGVTLL